MDIKVLIADHEDIIREVICDIAKKEGYIPVEARDGRLALDIFFGPEAMDIVLLDVKLPIYDGWAILSEIREYSDIPVILLSDLEDEKSEVKGLLGGADDYIAKPFSSEIFAARLKVAVRKLKKERLGEMTAGDIKINQATRRVSVGNVHTVLNRKEYNLLVYLIKNRDMVLTREQILSGIWGYDFDGGSRTVDTHIKTLRAKLYGCGSYIKTIRGTGYMFAVP